jgi:putative transcriptional regulator
MTLYGVPPPRNAIIFDMKLRAIPAVIALLLMCAAPSMADHLPLTPPSPHSYAPDARLSKGRFLVASSSMIDPRFSGTMILLVDYGVQGAIGLIINRPTPMKLSQAFDYAGFKKRDGALYLGGPVDSNQVFILLRSEKEVKGASRVFGDVYFSASEDVLQGVAGGRAEFRVFAGYAGWAPLQLEREVSLGAWRVMDADIDVIFSEKRGDPGKPGGP